MNRFFVLILVAVWSVFSVDAQTTFSKNLKAGKKQTVVFYGTSAAINPSNRFWVEQLQGKLDKRFPGKVDFYNCSKSGIGSFWATENFKDSVLTRNPDLLIFGFSENDAVLRFNNWPWYSGRCAEYDRPFAGTEPGCYDYFVYNLRAAFGQSCRNSARDSGV